MSIRANLHERIGAKQLGGRGKEGGFLCGSYEQAEGAFVKLLVRVILDKGGERLRSRVHDFRGVHPDEEIKKF